MDSFLNIQDDPSLAEQDLIVLISSMRSQSSQKLGYVVEDGHRLEPG
jgi:hypothetical protein